MAQAPRPGTPRDHGFDGFVVDVCSAVLDGLRAGGQLGDVSVHTRIVNAGNRFELLRTGDVHILCDPATIMPDRLNAAPRGVSGTPRRLNVSVPIYMSAVTFAQPREMPGGATPCRTLVGAVGETTALPRGIDRILETRSFGRWSTQIGDAMNRLRVGDAPETIAGLTNDPTCPDAPAFKAFPTHDEIARAFCTQQILFYVGDIEIIRSMLADEECLERSAIAPATFTDERYGIYTALPEQPRIASAILDFLAELSLQVHGTQTGPDGGSQTLLDRAYRASFPEFQPSQKLRAFFWSVTGSFPTRP